MPSKTPKTRKKQDHTHTCYICTQDIGLRHSNNRKRRRWKDFKKANEDNPNPKHEIKT